MEKIEMIKNQAYRPKIAFIVTQCMIISCVFLNSCTAYIVSTNHTGNPEIFRGEYRQRPIGFPFTNLTNHPYDDFWPSISPDGNAIVFLRRKINGTTFDVVKMDADGNNQINLTNTPQMNETSAKISPRGTHIAFTRRNQQDKKDNLYIMDIDGRGAVQLAAKIADFNFAFTPSGNYISYFVFENNKTELRLVDINSGSWWNIDKTPNRGAFYSCDGTRIYYVKTTTTGKMAIHSKLIDGILQGNIDAKRESPESSYVKLLDLACSFGGVDILLYEKDRPSRLMIYDKALNWEVQVASKSSSFQCATLEPIDYRVIYVSSDSIQIASLAIDKDRNHYFDIKNIGIGAQENVHTICNFLFSPDRKYILFSSRTKLYVAGVEGGNAFPVTDLPTEGRYRQRYQFFP